MMPEFLSVDDVLELHDLQIERYGGAGGLRERGLLESAVAQPEATFDQKFVHEDIYMMAAAYLFHIVKNHPFVDGNKRTGLLAMLVFLDLNGISIEHSTEEMFNLTLTVAEGRLDKQGVASTLKGLALA
jgi:death-on-curing protein